MQLQNFNVSIFRIQVFYKIKCTCLLTYFYPCSEVGISNMARDLIQSRIAWKGRWYIFIILNILRACLVTWRSGGYVNIHLNHFQNLHKQDQISSMIGLGGLRQSTSYQNGNVWCWRSREACWNIVLEVKEFVYW